MLHEDGAQPPKVKEHQTPDRNLKADRGDASRRLDVVIGRHLHDVPAATRTVIQRWIAGGRVSVNGHTILRSARRVMLDDRIDVALPDLPPRRTVTPEAIPLSVLLDDPLFLAADKPAGMIVHPAYRHPSGTLLNAVLAHAAPWPDGSRPSIVGRLDKMTSGIVLVAKSASAHAALQRAMLARTTKKLYLAIVSGRVTPRRGTIDRRLTRDAADRRRVVASDERGAPSVTRYERLASANGLSLIRCQLITGRMHQIRVHFASMGWPIVGDSVYGTSSHPAFARQALHAWRLEFVHPVTGRAVEIEAPIPSDMRVPGLGLERDEGLS